MRSQDEFPTLGLDIPDDRQQGLQLRRRREDESVGRQVTAGRVGPAHGRCRESRRGGLLLRGHVVDYTYVLSRRGIGLLLFGG